MQAQKYTWFRSIWFWWLITTSLYIILVTQGHALTNTQGNATLLDYIAGFIGLFVPYGVNSLILFFFSPLSWISLLFFIVAMSRVEKYLNTRQASFSRKIIYNFLALMLLTVIVDIIRHTPFESWRIFFNDTLLRSL